MTKDETGYNGWTNYETWNVNLWIDNDEGLYREKVAYIKRIKRPIEAADVECFFDTGMGSTTPDLENIEQRGEALDPINFAEIAERWEEERREMQE